MKFGLREVIFVIVMLGLLGSTNYFVFSKANKKKADLLNDIRTKQAALSSHRRLRDGVEHRVVAYRIVVVTAHTERDAPLYGVRDPDVIGRRQIGRAKIGADREVAARDVVADTRWRDVLAITHDAADRHRIPEMTVGAEHGRRVPLRRGAPFQLLDRRLVVVAEDLHGLMVLLSQVPRRGSSVGESTRLISAGSPVRVRPPAFPVILPILPCP